jgi:RNA polymerase primary sigma factor
MSEAVNMGKMYVIDENNKTLVDLVIKAKDGSENAKCEVLKRMESLLRKLAKENNSWKFGNGIDEDDLYQAGCQGVLKAIAKYEPKFKKTFSTYARDWVQACMSYMVYHNSATIRVPLLKARKFNQVMKDIETMSMEELSEKHNISEKKLKELQFDNPRTISMQDECNDDEHSGPKRKTEDCISYGEGTSPYMQVDEIERMRVFRECLSNLSEKERSVVEGFYGLTGGNRNTLVTLGRKYGCTSQNLYTIKSKAVEKLKMAVRERLGIESPESEEEFDLF